MGRPVWSYNLGVLIIVIWDCGATILEPIYWNSSNTKFAPGLGLVLYPQIGDKVDIVCPRMSTSPGGKGTRTGGSGEKPEYHRVYLVSRRQLERCSIDQSDAPLLNCDKPDRDVKFTFKFQEFSPNLWGLEFLRGRDYYITSTSTGALQGLDNTDGGVCRTKSIKLILRVGQSPSDPPSPPQESPTRYPPRHPKSGGKERPAKGNTNDITEETGTENTTGLLVGVACGIAAIIVIIIVLLLLLWRYRRRQRAPEGQQSASMSLNTLSVPKRGSVGSSDYNDSDRSDIVFPLRPSESMFCRHYERVSDYAAPVFIVQEVAQSPTNVYYKV